MVKVYEYRLVFSVKDEHEAMLDDIAPKLTKVVKAELEPVKPDVSFISMSKKSVKLGGYGD